MLNPTASGIVDEFTGPDYTIVDIAPWPDEYAHSPQGAWSEPCHFCNLPNNATHFIMSWCGACCVVGAIQNYTSILNSEQKSPFECDFDEGVEPCALEFLVHFVGDVHQPLHVAYLSDKGGNTVPVDFYNESTNLHAVWDTKIIERWDSDLDDAVSQLETIITNTPGIIAKYTADMVPIDWANESFDFVRSTCYNFTKNNEGVGQLGDEYYNTNLPIIQQRLIAAGIRLGQLLNTILVGKYNIDTYYISKFLKDMYRKY